MDIVEVETRLRALELVFQQLALTIFQRDADPVAAAEAYVRRTQGFSQTLVSMSFQQGNSHQQMQMIALSGAVSAIVEHLADDASADTA